ncbi:addiction module antidote protein [Rhizobium sp.]
MIKTTPFDASEYLTSDEMIAEYLSLTLEDENPEVFISALGDVAKAKGMVQIAKASGLSRESLYENLRSGSMLRDETVQKILKTFEAKLVAGSSKPADAA